MIVGVPREIKDHETRVGLVPTVVVALREAGHEVLVETHAGEGSSLTDQEYLQAGAHIASGAAEVWRKADLVVKVKEPQPAEYGFFRPGLILFTYLHLAPLPELTDRLLAAKVNGVAYETIRETDGSLPLLTPMSEVAGRMARAGGRAVSGKAQRRTRHSAGRRARRGAGQRGDSGRRRRGHQRRQDGARHGRARHHHRPQPEPPARARRHLQRPGGDAGFECLDHWREPQDRRPGGGRRADSRRLGAQAGAARNDRRHEARAQWWWMWPSIRAGASKPRTPPPTPSPSTSSMACCTIASPTCPPRCPTPPPSLSPTPRSPICWSWPTTAWKPPANGTPRCARASTLITAT